MRLFIPHLALAALAIGLYSRSLGFDFAYDDVLQITANPQVIDSHRGWTHLFAEPTPPGNLYRPLATLSYRLTHAAFGLHALPFHATNVLLYALICSAVYALFRAVMQSRFAAVLGAALFAAHPIHVEAVANIIGRAELGAALGALGAVFGARALAKRVEHPIAAGFWAGFVFCCILVGALFKESSITIVILLPLLAVGATHYASSGRTLRALGCLTPAIGGALVALTLRRAALGENFILRADGKIWPENPILHLSLLERTIPSLVTLGDYLRLLVLPLHLSADYSAMPADFLAHVYSWEGLVSGLFVLALGVTTLAYRSSSVAVWGLWIFATYVLTINFITPIGTLMGERLAFLPSVGACALLGITLSKLWERSPVFKIVPVFFIALFVGKTALRLPVWRDNSTLFEQTVIDNPTSPKAHYNLGVHYRLQRRNTALAEEEFKAALAIHPDYILALRALADIALERGDAKTLRAYYSKLLELTPDDALVRDNFMKLEEHMERRGL